MNRNECETLILQKLIEIRTIAAEYMEREPEYLGMCINLKDGEKFLWCHNRQWEDGQDTDKPIDAWKKETL